MDGTPEQIKNCREALCHTLGPWALIMPEEDVNKFMDRLQQKVNEVSKENENN